MTASTRRLIEREVEKARKWLNELVSDEKGNNIFLFLLVPEVALFGVTVFADVVGFKETRIGLTELKTLAGTEPAVAELFLQSRANLTPTTATAQVYVIAITAACAITRAIGKSMVEALGALFGSIFGMASGTGKVASAIAGVRERIEGATATATAPPGGTAKAEVSDTPAGESRE